MQTPDWVVDSWALLEKRQPHPEPDNGTLKQYPLERCTKEGIKPLIAIFLKCQLIWPCRSPYNTLILLVQKPGARNYHFVQDLRVINQIVVNTAGGAKSLYFAYNLIWRPLLVYISGLKRCLLLHIPKSWVPGTVCLCMGRSRDENETTMLRNGNSHKAQPWKDWKDAGALRNYKLHGGLTLQERLKSWICQEITLTWGKVLSAALLRVTVGPRSKFQLGLMRYYMGDPCLSILYNLDTMICV